MRSAIVVVLVLATVFPALPQELSKLNDSERAQINSIANKLRSSFVDLATANPLGFKSLRLGSGILLEFGSDKQLTTDGNMDGRYLRNNKDLPSYICSSKELPVVNCRFKNQIFSSEWTQEHSDLLTAFGRKSDLYIKVALDSIPAGNELASEYSIQSTIVGIEVSIKADSNDDAMGIVNSFASMLNKTYDGPKIVVENSGDNNGSIYSSGCQRDLIRIERKPVALLSMKELSRRDECLKEPLNNVLFGGKLPGFSSATKFGWLSRADNTRVDLKVRPGGLGGVYVDINMSLINDEAMKKFSRDYSGVILSAKKRIDGRRGGDF